MAPLSEDIALLNRVANRPEVLSGIAPNYFKVDLSRFFDNPRNVLWGDERGLVLFGHLGADVFEMHYLMTNRLAGPEAFQAIKAAIRALFTYHNAIAICGGTPRENRPARAVNRALGGRPIGVSQDSQGRPCINYMLERARWVQLSGV